MKGTDVIHQGREEIGRNAGPMLASRYMGQGRMTTLQGRAGSRIPLWPDGEGPEDTGNDLPWNGISSGVTKGG